MKINNLNITARLALSFSLVLTLLTAVALLGINSMSSIQSQLSTITNVNMIKMEQAATMRATILDRMIALRNLVLLSDSQELASEVERIQKGKVTYDMAKAELARVLEREGGGRKTEQELVMQIQAVETEILPLMSKAEKLGLERKSDATTAVLIKEIRPLQRKWINAVTTLVGLQKQLSAEQTTIARTSYDNSRMLMIALTICAIASGIVAAVLVARSITRPLHKAVVIAETVASGDLSSCIESTSNDETGRLLAALAKMNSNLAEIVGKVRAGSGTIAIASSEIATGNLDLSSRTEQQASSLEETASSMEEITSAVKHNAENARQANDLAMIASSVASKGGQVVAEVIDTMNSIDASARKIVDIIGVIDSIAFQTNILALNAAVEAARAGDQGRGFAVVASEVRNLAQRSATAAKEIKLLIDDSVEKVSTGTRLVGEAGTTIKQVVKSVQSVTAVVSDISAASREQELGIAQINKAIAEIDDVTQQNAALVEEASAAASSLQEHAGSLAKLVEFFVVGQAGSVSDHQVTNGATAEKAAQSSYGKVVALTSKVARNNDRVLYTGRRQTMVSNGVADGNWEEF